MRVRVTAKQPYGYMGVQLRNGDIVTEGNPVVLDVENESDIIEPLLRSFVTIEYLDEEPGGVESGQSTENEVTEAGRKRRPRSEEAETPEEQG